MHTACNQMHQRRRLCLHTHPFCVLVPAQDLAARLCASPAAAGPTLLSAFEQPGSEDAATAVAAAAQLCADGRRTGTHYMHAANPDADHSAGRRALE